MFSSILKDTGSWEQQRRKTGTPAAPKIYCYVPPKCYFLERTVGPYRKM